MDPISQTLATNALWQGIVASTRWVFGTKIRITHPRPHEILTDAQPLGSSVKFPVRGTLKRLPKDHEIWVLTQDDATGKVRPQGFQMVEFNPEIGKWTGWINGSGRTDVRIVAVVAPPTSHDFFRYFQKLGELREWAFEPLDRIPPECTNLAWVQAKVPKR